MPKTACGRGNPVRTASATFSHERQCTPSVSAMNMCLRLPGVSSRSRSESSVRA